jgi:DNA-binding LacI/PurR family transcriptional regulator
MATLKDIAQMAGVSVDTVSRVLNGKAGEAWPSAVERAERIRKLAVQLNYTPNKAARIMRTNKTHQIGVLVSELYNPFTGRKVEAIADALAGFGYEMLLGLTRSRAVNPAKFYEKFSENLLDGVINLDPLLSTDDLRTISPRVPCVTFNRSREESPAVFDVGAAVKMLMEHLWSLGHRRIAIVTGFDKGDAARSRVSAYQSFYAARPIAQEEGWVIEANWTSEEGQRAARPLVDTGCTACVAGNDLLAVGLIVGLRALQVDVPGDISLVSIEDSLLTEVSHPTLTSARQPVRELVDMTVAALAAIIGGEPMPVCQVLQPQLIVRNSSCAPNARV